MAIFQYIPKRFESEVLKVTQAAAAQGTHISTPKEVVAQTFMPKRTAAAQNASISKNTQLSTVNPTEYAGSLLFGVPGAIASGVMALNQGQPTETTTTVTGISPTQAAQLYQSTPTQPTPTAQTSVLDGIGEITDLALKIAPLILILGLFGSIKKLF